MFEKSRAARLLKHMASTPALPCTQSESEPTTRLDDSPIENLFQQCIGLDSLTVFVPSPVHVRMSLFSPQPAINKYCFLCSLRCINVLFLSKLLYYFLFNCDILKLRVKTRDTKRIHHRPVFKTRPHFNQNPTQFTQSQHQRHALYNPNPLPSPLPHNHKHRPRL